MLPRFNPHLDRQRRFQALRTPPLHQLHRTRAPYLGAHRLLSPLPGSVLNVSPGAAATSYPTRRRRDTFSTSTSNIKWKRPSRFAYPTASRILSSAGIAIISARIIGVSRLTNVDRCMPGRWLPRRWVSRRLLVGSQ